jgi:HK97 family phage portal protein
MGVIKTLTYDGKALRMDDLPEAAWDAILGEEASSSALWRQVPWANRGVKIRASYLASLPFQVKRGDTVIEEDDLPRMVPFIRNWSRMLWMLEASQVIYGASYLLNEGTPRMPANVRVLAAKTIKPDWDHFRKTGELQFIRKLGRGAEPRTLDAEQVVYIWQSDPDVEIGPPESSDLDAAGMAAGVLRSTDKFTTAFYDRGAIKGTIISLKGNVDRAERQKFKSWWSRIFRGLDNAWGEGIINADAVDITPIGEGLESLENKELTNARREDIATGLGVPQSILFSNAANFAVAEEDKRTFYEGTVVPQSNLIQATLNEQLFEPAGFRMEFMHQNLDIFQEDEEDRSGALVNYVNAGMRLETAVAMLGLEIPEGMMLEEEKPQPSAEPVPMVGGTLPEPENERALDLWRTDLERWQRKSLKRLKSRGSASCSFDSDHISGAESMMIQTLLDDAQTADDVKAIFEAPLVGMVAA